MVVAATPLLDILVSVAVAAVVLWAVAAESYNHIESVAVVSLSAVETKEKKKKRLKLRIKQKKRHLTKLLWNHRGSLQQHRLFLKVFILLVWHRIRLPNCALI